MDGDTDLSGLPIAYLESYPFPAFVVVVPLSIRRPRLFSRDTDTTIRGHPLGSPRQSVAWANERWFQLTEGRNISDCIDRTVYSHLQSWMEDDVAKDEEVPFTLEMRLPSITLSLVKTILPLSPPSSTSAFCVVTSQKIPLLSQSSSAQSSISDIAMSATSSSSSYFPNSALSPPLPSPRLRSSKGARYSPFQEKPPPFHYQMRNASAECQALIEQVDWSKTKLGPRSTWPEAIDPILSITFQSPSQDSVWLGEDFNLIYNQSYATLIRDHPATFGRPAKEIWASIWHGMQPMAEQGMAGIPTYRENDLQLFRTHGNGILQESYHTWRFVPMTDGNGRIIGLFNQSMDTTESVLAERRLATVRGLSGSLSVCRDSKEYYTSVAEAFEQNPKDAPFIIMYSVNEIESENTVELQLTTTVGVPEDHPSTPKSLNFHIPPRHRTAYSFNTDRLSSPTLSAISALSSGSGRINDTSECRAWPIQKALSQRQCIVVEDCAELIHNYPLRQWDSLPVSAIVIPICSDSSTDVAKAVMILGLNLRRPLDAEYDDWIHVIRAHLTSALNSVKAYEAEQRQLEDRARMERAKSAWFQGAAHDLRSPLTLVAGPIEDLLATNLSPNQRSSLSLAKRNVDRLLRLVNSLMDFSRLEAGRVEGRFVPTNLGEFATDLAALFRPAVERMRIEYKVDIQPHDGLVWIDPVLFETVVSNLIGNALKYTEDGSITVQVRYTDFAEVSVIDTGFGIPSNEIGLVADRFHRATTALTRGAEGTGLGLALARELLRLHDGELVIESHTAQESGGAHGSTFTARVPLTPRVNLIETDAPMNFGAYTESAANDAMRWARDDKTDSSSDNGNESQNSSTSRLTGSLLFDKEDVLLVADDNAEIRTYIKRIFSPYCKVMEADNGQQALEMAILNPPNLILSDVMMPVMDGLELLKRIREHPATKIIPMVLLSAASGDEPRVDSLIMGAEDYMAKPFKPQELLARVHLHMQVGKKRAALETRYAQREVEIALLSDYCPTGIMRADKDGHMLYANAAWREHASMSADDDLDHWPKYCDPETQVRLGPVWFEILNGEERATRVQWKWKNGRTMAGIFIRLDKVVPGMTGILGCLNDITYEEERLVEAEQRRIEAEESKHQQELLIDLTSHEIRTPVSAILQCSSLVKENLVALKDQLRIAGTTGFIPSKELLDDLEEDVEALESIYQCGLVQERIAGDVLSLARIQLDMLSLHHIEMDLKREARKVFSVFASEARMKKIDLVLEFGETLEIGRIKSIKTDPVRLGQVVTNLISNAIRFTASSDTRKITVKYEVSFVPPAEDGCALPQSIGLPDVLPSAEDTPIWLFVSVTDTGPGLGPKELAILFQRFSQGNKMIHTRYGGSGLGLFICRKITELLGGRIEVKSQLGEGSVFRFFIQTRTVAPPYAVAAFKEVSLPPSEPLSETSSSSSNPSVDEESLHILIVEDNIINQTVLKRQILKAGLTCDVANNGLEALNLIGEAHRQSRRGGVARKKPYNVILMDLEMPVMDGLTAVREIRESEAAGKLSKNIVIALTGNARQGQIDQAIAAGMDDVVIKPYVLKDLLDKMRAISARHAALGDGLLDQH